MTTRLDDTPKRALDVLVTGSIAPLAGELVRALRERGHQVRVLDVIDDGETHLLPPAHAARTPTTDPGLLAHAVTTADVTVLLTGLGPLTAVVDDAAALDAILGHARPGSALIELSTLAVFGNHGAEPADEATEPAVPPGLEPVRVVHHGATKDRDCTFLFITNKPFDIRFPSGNPA